MVVSFQGVMSPRAAGGDPATLTPCLLCLAYSRHLISARNESMLSHCVHGEPSEGLLREAKGQSQEDRTGRSAGPGAPLSTLTAGPAAPFLPCPSMSPGTGHGQ